VGEPAQGPHLSDGGAPAVPERRGRLRRALPLAILALVVLTLLAAGATAVTLLRVVGPLRDGRDELQAGRSAIIRGDAEGAAEAFDRAGASFAQARSATGGAIGWMARAVPFVGANARVAHALADAGADAAEAGSHLTDAVRGLPGGFEALAPSRGAVPLAALQRITPDVTAASGLIAGGLFDLERSPDGFLLGPVSSAREQALETFTGASGTLRAASGLLEAAPDLAGGRGPRRYFFGASNPAELRGTGGLIGAFAIVTVDDGRFRISPFAPIQTLHDFPARKMPAPSPDYRENYDQFGGAGDWSNLNLTPDFPSAARAILSLYQANTGRPLDGVIVADPVALSSVLRVTGPTPVPHLGVSIDADNVVAFTEERAYSLFQTQPERKEVLGAAASVALERFLGMGGNGVERIRALTEAASGGHIVMYAKDPAAERGLETAGVAGALTVPSGGDALAVVVNSASGSKVDYWSTRSVDYRVQLQSQGDARTTTDVTLHNAAPSKGEPRYVIGPFPHLGLAPGDMRSLVSIYCVPGCRGFGATRNGNTIGVRLGSELGFRWYQDVPVIHPGDSSTFHLGTVVPGVWQGDDHGGTYVLRYLDQPTTHPTQLRVEVTAPPGMSITSTSMPMRVQGSTATWEGVPSYRMQLSVSFAPSLPVRAWRTLTDWLP